MRPGSLLLEALLAIALFAIFMGAVSIGLFLGQEGTLRSGDRVRGVFLSERALQAARSIRDNDYAGLTVGSHGICEVAGRWQFCGTESESEDHYRTSVTVTSLSVNRTSIFANTFWNFSRTRSGSVVLSEELTNWRAVKPLGDWSLLQLKGEVIDETPGIAYRSVAVTGGYAYVTTGSPNSNGLLVYNVSTDGAPVSVPTTITIGGSASGITVGTNRLYVVVKDWDAEVKIVDISSPEALSNASILGAIDIPGNGRAQFVALFGPTLFVAASDDETLDQFYAYDVSDPRNPLLLASYHDAGGTYNAIALHEGFAYIAATHDESEIKVLDVFDTINHNGITPITITDRIGANPSDVPDGLSIATVGTKLLFGRSENSLGNEFIVYSLLLGPTPSNNPNYWSIGGAVNGIATDPAGSYAFIASGNPEAQIQVVDLSQTLPVGTFDLLTSGIGRSIAYDSSRDRVILVTDHGIALYGPR
ncbi:MAG: hypothetical protein WCG83_06870 [Candidatus Peregrinibacteria bacterium]